MPVHPAPSNDFPGAWTTRQIQADSHWRSVQKMIVDGQMAHSWRGSYISPAAPLPARLSALELAIGVPLVACHATAAALHGFGVVNDGLLHETSADGRSLRKRQGVVVHQWIPRSDPVFTGGFLATAAPDTAIDVVCTSKEIDVLAILDAALRCGVMPAELTRAMAKAWLPFASGAAESPMESRTRFRTIAAGLPAPELQIRVDVPGGVRWLDMGWRTRRIGLEYDGEEFHSGDGKLASDRQRHNELVRAGWTMVYATAADIYRRPDPFVAHLRTLIGPAPS